MGNEYETKNKNNVKKKKIERDCDSDRQEVTGETYVCIVKHGERGRGRGKERVCVEERQNIMNLFR